MSFNLILSLHSGWTPVKHSAVLHELWELFLWQFSCTYFKIVFAQLCGMFSIFLLLIFMFPFSSLSKQSMHRLVANQRLKGHLPHSRAVSPSRAAAEAALSMFNGGGGRHRNVVPCSCSLLHMSQTKIFVLKVWTLFLKISHLGPYLNCFISNISFLPLLYINQGPYGDYFLIRGLVLLEHNK